MKLAHHMTPSALMLVLTCCTACMLAVIYFVPDAHSADTDKASLHEQIASFTSERDALVIDSPHAVSADLTVPANMLLRFTSAGRLEIADGVTVTIDGPIDAPLWCVFAGPGTATFGSRNTAVRELYPQWWGARGDGEHDDTGAIQAALDAARDMGGGEVVITKGTFRTSKTLHVWGVEKWDTVPREILATRSIRLRGVSRRSSVIHYTGQGACVWLCTNPNIDGQTYHHSAAVVEMLHLRGESRNGIGLQVAAPASTGSWGGTAIVENNCIEFFDTGLYVEHSYGSRFSHNKIRYNNTGVQLGNAAGPSGTINGNTFRDNEIGHNHHVGLHIYYGKWNLFEGGLIEHNGDEGVHIERTGAVESDHITFRNIWFEKNQKGKAAANLGQVYLHSAKGKGYDSLHQITFERCLFHGQGPNFNMRIGNTLSLHLIYNKFGHPNDRIIYRMPDTHCQWAVVRTHNEPQNMVIQGILAGNTAAAGDQQRNDIQGTAGMPSVYLPAPSSQHHLTAQIEADARTHNSIASAAGVFTTQHTVAAGTNKVSPPLVLPKGSALIGLSIYSDAETSGDVTVALRINEQETNLEMTLTNGAKAGQRTFELGDYRQSSDWVSDSQDVLSFECSAAEPVKSNLHIVALWRCNHLPVF